MSTIEAPTHAYLPGQNERHPIQAFDALRQTADPTLQADGLAACQAFTAGIQFLNQGYYWEAHELLEPVWMALPACSKERQFVQGLIQLANGYLKLRMGRPKTAVRLVALARGLVTSSATGVATSTDATNRTHSANSATIMMLDLHEVYRWIDALEKESVMALSTP